MILKEMKLVESLMSTSEALHNAMEDYVDAVANSTDHDPVDMLREQVEGFIESYETTDESWADPDDSYSEPEEPRSYSRAGTAARRQWQRDNP